MEVDGSGAAVQNSEESTSGKSNKKLWIIIFSSFAVVIVGLIIAIAVVLINRNSNQTATEEPVEWYNDVEETYDNYKNEIADKIVSTRSQNDVDAIKSIYRTYIDQAENETVRLMLEEDRYMMIMSFDYTMAQRIEVIDGMLAADEILKTPESAAMVIAAATYYGDSNLSEKYTEIMQERINAGLDEINTNDGADENNGNSDDDASGGESEG